MRVILLDGIRPRSVICKNPRLGASNKPAFFRYSLAHPTRFAKIDCVPLGNSSDNCSSVRRKSVPSSAMMPENLCSPPVRQSFQERKHTGLVIRNGHSPYLVRSAFLGDEFRGSSGALSKDGRELSRSSSRTDNGFKLEPAIESVKQFLP